MRFFPAKGLALFFSVLVLVLSLASVRGATNLISGQVTTNTTWSGTNLLQGTVTIQSNIVVTITPGTVMLMNTGATLIVNGQLLADGTTNQPITFTRATTAARWSRMMFVRAADSRFRHCIIEYANSAGDHQDYYPTNCTTGLGFSPRPYHEAVIALASHLDFEGCTFRNLVGGDGGNEGDAIAIITDDPQAPGTASAHVRSCRFDGIGQGVHTRFSFVLVENCYFANKHGDNDDVDLYGESTPVPVIRFNTFLAGHEDKINPTRCSAIIYGNFFSGGDDHGVVLRDKCYPIVFNNIFSNFAAAAISVQNQCDALIANNTIINSGRGIRMFDHTARHGPPYCLFPGNGKATIINCIIWNTPSGAVTMEASTFLPHPEVRLIHCDIQGGA
ncbi:MAG TPA: right-handed parallel beta-helix repeat-containing protein, partial [Candidatus Limnocylindria bacterium]|nr:right-handed parallel beta-helix repeat-containing protein [Candidatus Limnocylindria bacterium]